MGDPDPITKEGGEELAIIWNEEEHRLNYSESNTETKVSLHALMGSTGTGTIKVQGLLQNKPISILLDSRLTHNFVSKRLAKLLSLRTTPCTPFQITVANGEHLECTSSIDNLSWSMAGQTFSTHVNVIPLGGYDIILVVEWMSLVSPVTFDYSKDQVTITWGSKQITLSQCKLESTIQPQLSAPKPILHQEEVCYLIQITAIDDDSPSSNTKPLLHTISSLIGQYKDVFVAPSGLPPNRK